MKFKEFITEEQFYYLKDHNLLSALGRIVLLNDKTEYEEFIFTLKHHMNAVQKPMNRAYKDGTRPIHLSWIIFGVLIEHIFKDFGMITIPTWFKGLVSFTRVPNLSKYVTDSVIEFPHQGLWSYLVNKKFINLNKGKIGG